MDELEHLIARLDLTVVFPPTPDLAAHLSERLRADVRRRRGIRAAALVGIAAVSAALAVPQSRATLERWLHIGAISVERRNVVPTGITKPLQGTLGAPVSIGEAARRLTLPLVLPNGRESVVLRAYARHRVAVLILRGAKRQILLTEVAYVDVNVIEKIVGPRTSIVPVDVNRDRGYWLSGGPHVLQFQSRSGALHQVPLEVSGNVLAWQHGDLTLRIEGDISESAALRMAALLRPLVGKRAAGK